jgi:hypothetical protein
LIEARGIVVLYLFIVQGEGGWKLMFFFPKYMKRWKEEGERGTFRVF